MPSGNASDSAIYQLEKRTEFINIFSFKLDAFKLRWWKVVCDETRHECRQWLWFFKDFMIQFLITFCCICISKMHWFYRINSISIGDWLHLTMGLLPLEFTDCLTNSPYFRENLHAHEKELERTSQSIKLLIKEVKDLLTAAKREFDLSIYYQNICNILKTCKHFKSHFYWSIQINLASKK